MSYFLLPLDGLLPLVTIVGVGLTLTALLDVVVHPRTAFRSFGKLPKRGWLAVLTVGLAVSVIGIVASVVYFARVRPWVHFATALQRGEQPDTGDEVYIRA